MPEIRLQVKFASVPVFLENDKGETEEYELREMSTAERERYVQELEARFERNPDATIKRITRFDGMHADLLTKCVYSKKTGAKVELRTVKDWPPSVSMALFDEAQKLNKLNVPAQEVAAEAKKE